MDILGFRGPEVGAGSAGSSGTRQLCRHQQPGHLCILQLLLLSLHEARLGCRKRGGSFSSAAGSCHLTSVHRLVQSAHHPSHSEDSTMRTHKQDQRSLRLDQDQPALIPLQCSQAGLQAGAARGCSPVCVQPSAALGGAPRFRAVHRSSTWPCTVCCLMPSRARAPEAASPSAGDAPQPAGR